MPLFLLEDAAVFGTHFPLDRFSASLAVFLAKYPGTYRLERIGKELIAADFPEESIPEFIREVCGWGGYAGIAARILKDNAVTDLRSAFLEAAAELDSDESNVGRALSAINRLHGLGTPSFASKHLRFIAPSKCPILDAILRDVLPYSFNFTGYTTFAADCSTVASMLNERGIANPHVKRPTEWWVADVEAALFAEANGWVEH